VLKGKKSISLLKILHKELFMLIILESFQERKEVKLSFKGGLNV